MSRSWIGVDELILRVESEGVDWKTVGIAVGDSYAAGHDFFHVTGNSIFFPSDTKANKQILEGFDNHGVGAFAEEELLVELGWRSGQD